MSATVEPTSVPAGPARLAGPDVPTRQRAAIGEVVVVVPVHDEQELLGRCLRSIRLALDHPQVRPLRSRVVVALDACRDGSAEVARQALRPEDRVVELDARNVGRARAVATALGLDAANALPTEVWLAHTDADTTVPRHWLARQLALATTVDAVAGVVRVADWSPHDRGTRRAHDRRYRISPLRPHPHVHGANLGVRASAYLAVGGFPHQACSEDHALWDALRMAGHGQRSSRRVWVTTSARRDGRAVGGFADALNDLARRTRPGPAEPLGPAGPAVRVR